MEKDTNKLLKITFILSELLDNKFRIGRFRFGLDPIIGLLPVGGDIISLCISLFIIFAAYWDGIPWVIVRKMIGNVLLDFLVGLLPFIGDYADFIYKANSLNIQLIKDYLNKNQYSDKPLNINPGYVKLPEGPQT